MKKYLLIVFLFSVTVNAQSFIFSTPVTTKTGNPLSEIIFSFLCKNISQDTITLDFVRQSYSVPNGWTCNLCFDVSCFAAFVDSISTTEDFNSSPLAPGAVRDVSVHFFTLPTPGSGNCTVYMKNRRNPSDKISVTLQASTLNNAVDISEPKEFAVSLPYPVPAKGSISVQVFQAAPAELTAILYDITGNEINRVTFAHPGRKVEIITLPVPVVAEGVYFLKVNSPEGKKLLPVTIQKEAR